MDIEKEYWGMPANTYCMLLHLSQLSNFVAPSLGIILPIMMWILNKDKDERIDQQGKTTINWILSLLIYSIVPLIFILTGLKLLTYLGMLVFLVLAITYFVFPIIAAVKINEGQQWKYPFSIIFIK